MQDGLNELDTEQTIGNWIPDELQETGHRTNQNKNTYLRNWKLKNEMKN